MSQEQFRSEESTSESLPAPGWYVSTTTGYQRWWDGERWVGGDVPAPQSATAATATQPVDNRNYESSLEAAAWACAMLGVIGIGVLSLVAIALGIINNGQRRDAGYAASYGPIVLGIVGLVTTFFIWVYLLPGLLGS